MDISLWLNIGFGIVTVISFIYAIHANKEKSRAVAAEEKWKNLYKTNCQGKCITIAGIARELVLNASNSCKYVRQCESFIKNSNNSKVCDPLIRLSSYIYSTRTSTNSLIDFCRVLKIEFENHFNEPILENFEERVPQTICDESN